MLHKVDCKTFAYYVYVYLLYYNTFIHFEYLYNIILERYIML
jgi:hypothetical protein